MSTFTIATLMSSNAHGLWDFGPDHTCGTESFHIYLCALFCHLLADSRLLVTAILIEVVRTFLRTPMHERPPA